MKNLVRTILVMILAAAASSCSKDTVAPVSTLPTSPEAQSADDSKSGGVYKGTIVGSSGVLKIVLQKGVKEIQMTISGVSKTLTTTSLDTWTSGEIIRNALFTKDDWQVMFNVGAAGIGASVTMTIPGHASAEAILTKETSKAIVRVFEGTYTGSESGSWNFVIQGGALSGISRSTGGLTTTSFVGLVNGTVITLDSIQGSGTISGDNASGTWVGSSPDINGTWTGKRIL